MTIKLSRGAVIVHQYGLCTSDIKKLPSAWKQRLMLETIFMIWSDEPNEEGDDVFVQSTLSHRRDN